MSEPIKAGDMAEVTNGSRGKDSPNIGLIVRVHQLVYECPQLGRIWRCEAEYAEKLVLGPGCTCPPGMADFAQSWLRKIEPPPAPASTSTRELEKQTASLFRATKNPRSIKGFAFFDS